MISHSHLSLVCLSIVSLATAAAGPISYTLSATASGTLGAATFNNAVVTVTLTGNTANIVPGQYNTVKEFGSAIVNVAGVGSAFFTGQIEIDDTLTGVTLGGSPAVVIGQTDPGGLSATGILGQLGTVFATYDLSTALGPVFGTGGAFSGSHVTPHFATSVGDMTWAVGQPNTPSTFIATLLNSQSAQGGSAAAPTFLATSSLGQVSGSIGGGFAQDYYSFNWGGGFFSVTAGIAGALSTDTFTLSEGPVGSCIGGASAQLNQADSFSGAIGVNLAPGTYCVGLSTSNIADPTGTLTFNTALNTVPEPADFALALTGILALAAYRFKRQRA